MKLKGTMKIIFITALSAVVLSCTVTSADIFSERSMSKTTFSGSLPSQTEKISGSGTQAEISKLEPLPSEGEETERKGINIKFDPYTEQDGSSLNIEPSDTIKPSPELLEKARKIKGEAKRIRTGLFNTELDIMYEENRVVASVSLNNISPEDLRLNFDVGGEFDFIVIDSEGNEVYSRLQGDKVSLPAISSRKLKKGEKLLFTYTWNCKNNEGNIISPGKYSISVKMLPAINYKRNFSPFELSAEKDIEIK